MARLNREADDNYCPPSVDLAELVINARRLRLATGRRQMIHPHAQDYACDHRCYELLPAFGGVLSSL
jgi:hypothetical protein